MVLRTSGREAGRGALVLDLITVARLRLVVSPSVPIARVAWSKAGSDEQGKAAATRAGAPLAKGVASDGCNRAGRSAGGARARTTLLSSVKRVRIRRRQSSRLVNESDGCAHTERSQMVRRQPASAQSEQPEPNIFELGGEEPAVGTAWYSEENVEGDDLEESIDAEELQGLDIAQDAEGAFADVRVCAVSVSLS